MASLVRIYSSAPLARRKQAKFYGANTAPGGHGQCEFRTLPSKASGFVPAASREVLFQRLFGPMMQHSDVTEKTFIQAVFARFEVAGQQGTQKAAFPTEFLK